jgi:hypothetical protein
MVELKRSILVANVALAIGENPGQRWLLADLTETVTQHQPSANRRFGYR